MLNGIYGLEILWLWLGLLQVRQCTLSEAQMFLANNIKSKISNPTCMPLNLRLQTIGCHTMPQ